MANIAIYEVHIRAEKKAALLISASLPGNDSIKIIEENNKYIIHVSGECHNGIESHTENSYDGSVPSLDCYSEEQLKNGEFVRNNIPLWNTTLEIKSKLFSCEIEVYCEGLDEKYKIFSSYKNGKTITYNSKSLSSLDEYYEWDKDEYPDYEEFCEEMGITPEELSESDFCQVYDNIYEYIPGNDFEYEFTF